MSDEFTVPLCAIHHTMNHATGDERRWWQDQKLDPLNEAAKLWRQSYPQSHGLQKGADLRRSEV